MDKILRLLFATVYLFAFSGFSDEESELSESQEKLPIGSEIYFSQNVGAGTFFKPYGQDPYVASNLELFPYYKYGPFLGDREIKIHAEISSCFEWVGQGNAFLGPFADKFSMKDVKIRAEFKNALRAKDLGVTLSPALKLEAPLSKVSRLSNRVIGVGGFLVANWSGWGFSVTYKPVLVGYVYSSNYNTGDCNDESPEDDKLAFGKCKAPGRQSMMVVKNGFTAAYTKGNHGISLLFRTYHSFLRGAGLGEKPEAVASSGIMEATLGVMEYAYNLPLTLPTTIILGLSGEQSYYDAAFGFRMPFFNFAEPLKNITEAYVAVNMTI